MKKLSLLLLVLLGGYTSFASTVTDSLRLVLPSSQPYQLYTMLWKQLEVAEVTIKKITIGKDSLQAGAGLMFTIESPPAQVINPYYQMIEVPMRYNPALMDTLDSFISKGRSYVNYIQTQVLPSAYCLAIAKHIIESKYHGITKAPLGWYGFYYADIMYRQLLENTSKSYPELGKGVIHSGKDVLELVGYKVSDDHTLMEFHIRGTVTAVSQQTAPLLHVKAQNGASNLSNSFLLKIPKAYADDLVELAGSPVYYVNANGEVTKIIAALATLTVTDGTDNIAVLIEPLY